MNETQQSSDGGGFARTVRPDKTENLRFLNREAYVLDSARFAIVFFQMAYFDDVYTYPP